jgi:hypothetical protein
MPRVSHDEGPLTKLVRELEMHWEMTAYRWKDQARTDFENAYLKELIPEVKRAADAIGRVNRLLQKAIRECS